MPIREVIRLPNFNGLRFSWLPEVIPASPVVGSWSAYAGNGGAVMNLFHSGVASTKIRSGIALNCIEMLAKPRSKCSPNRTGDRRGVQPWQAQSDAQHAQTALEERQRRIAG